MIIKASGYGLLLANETSKRTLSEKEVIERSIIPYSLSLLSDFVCYAPHDATLWMNLTHLPQELKYQVHKYFVLETNVFKRMNKLLVSNR